MKSKNNGNLYARIGGLFTILSLSVIEDRNWKIAAAVLDVALALYGIILIQKAKKQYSQGGLKQISYLSS